MPLRQASRDARPSPRSTAGSSRRRRESAAASTPKPSVRCSALQREGRESFLSTAAHLADVPRLFPNQSTVRQPRSRRSSRSCALPPPTKSRAECLRDAPWRAWKASASRPAVSSGDAVLPAPLHSAPYPLLLTSIPSFALRTAARRSSVFDLFNRDKVRCSSVPVLIDALGHLLHVSLGRSPLHYCSSHSHRRHQYRPSRVRATFCLPTVPPLRTTHAHPTSNIHPS